MRVTAKATRSGKWWAVEVPEIPGLFTQTRRLDQIPEMVADAATTLGYPDVEVVVSAELPVADMEVVQAAKTRGRALREAEALAARANRDAVALLRGQDLPVRDVATLMGISPQRVSAIK